MFRKKLFEYLLSNKQKNLPVKIFIGAFGFLAFVIWIIPNSNLTFETQRLLVRWAMISWLFFSGLAGLIMALRQEVVQLRTIRGPAAVIYGLLLAIGFWFLAIMVIFII